MADYSPSQNTKGAAVLTPRKGQLKSFFDFFGGKTLRLNNDLGAMAIFFFRSFFHDISYQADTGNYRPGIFYRRQIHPDCVAGRFFHWHGAGAAAVFRSG